MNKPFLNGVLRANRAESRGLFKVAERVGNLGSKIDIQ